MLEEVAGDTYTPAEDEILQYAAWLGMDVDKDEDLFWIAIAGLQAPLPADWRACKTPEHDIFYFNLTTHVSVWEHPSDELYRHFYLVERAKKYGETPDKEDESYVDSRASELPSRPTPCIVASLSSSVNPSGEVEICATSMGGNVLAISKLKGYDDSLKAVHRRLNRRAGQELKLVLPDGVLVEKADSKTPIKQLLVLPVQADKVLPDESPRRKKVLGVLKQPPDLAYRMSSQTSRSSMFRQVSTGPTLDEPLSPLKMGKQVSSCSAASDGTMFDRQVSTGSTVDELSPLKVAKRPAFRRFDVSASSLAVQDKPGRPGQAVDLM